MWSIYECQHFLVGGEYHIGGSGAERNNGLEIKTNGPQNSIENPWKFKNFPEQLRIAKYWQ